MNCCTRGKVRRDNRGMTLVELMVSVGLGGLVLGSLMMIFCFGMRSFAGLGEYASLTGQSRLALDRMSREIRSATRVLSTNTNLPIKTLALTNAIDGTWTTYTWDS